MATILENIKRAKRNARNECDDLLKDNGKITEAEIREEIKVALKRKLGANFHNFKSLVSEITEKFRLMYNTKSGKILELSDDKDHKPWLEDNPDRIKNGEYWEIYKTYLKEEENFAEAAINDIDSSTQKILAKLEDPQDASHSKWDRRGVVIGSIQSGKTANFIGLINKARDAGYKFIVVLSGTNNDLRQQTQERIDDGFIGYYTSTYSEAKGNPQVYNFLGKLRQNKFPDKHQWPLHGTFNKLNGDFNKAAFERLPKQNLGNNRDASYIFVIKKNKTPLTRLIQWLLKHSQCKAGASGFERVPPLNETNTSDPPFINDFPILVLDDECDHYSVDTKERPEISPGVLDEEYDPKTINGLIRKLLFCFSRRGYVGYTATPFANIFIHEGAYAKNYGPDLFPKSFMFDIRPPSNHQGLETLFAETDEDDPSGADQSNFIITISDFCENSYDLFCNKGWVPYKHNKNHIPIYDQNSGILDEDLLDEDTLNFYIELLEFSGSNNTQKINLPPSIIHAVMSFIIASTIRNVRSYEEIFSHKSMLIHVSKFINVQEKIEIEIQKLIKSILDVLRYKKEFFFKSMKHIYENYFLEHTKEFKSNKKVILFEELEHHEKGIEWIIKEINGRDGESNIYRMSGKGGNKPNYRKYKNDWNVGLTTIIIGGDKLSRGVTFEGLTTSYFLRASRMYDTLMQMGRWFGYRQGYEDVCRLYTSAELRQNFIDINIASERLRARVSYMQEHKRTPADFGLAVQQSPGLLITSKVKMRDGHEFSLDFSGSGIQMTTLPWDVDVIKSNFQITSDLIKTLGKESEGPEITRNRGKIPNPKNKKKQELISTWKNTHVWTNVSNESVVDYLRSFKEHENSNFHCEQISRYISDAVGQNCLTNWNVVLCGNGNSKHQWEIGNKKVELIERMPSPDSNSNEKKASFGAIWDPKDETMDISNDDYLAAWLAAEKDKLEDDRNSNIKFSQEIRRKRSEKKGILLIYPILPVLRETVIKYMPEKIYKGNDFKLKAWNPFKEKFVRQRENIKDIYDRKPIISIAISLPEIDKEISIPYVGNNIFYAEEQKANNN